MNGERRRDAKARQVFGLDAPSPDGLQEPRRSKGRDVPRIFRPVKTDSHMALGSEMVNLIRPQIMNELGQLAGVGEITEIEKQPYSRDV